MASVPPEDGSILPDGWTWSDVGHGALDVVGFIPLVGEGADLANAAWYAAEGNYLDAGLSVISMVPFVGDIIGKGGKIAKKAGGKLTGPALDALRKMDFKKTLEPLRQHPKIGPHVDKMAEALEKWRKDLVGEAPLCTPGGAQVCPLSQGAKPAAIAPAKAAARTVTDTGTQFTQEAVERASNLTDKLATATGEEAERIAEELARISTHSAGDGSRTVLGKWPGYIEEAKKGGTWFETPPEFFDQLKGKVGPEEAKEKAWLVNEAFLKQQMSQGKVFEFTAEGIEHAAKNPDSMTAREITFHALQRGGK